jgi:hypothetical protein
MRRLSPRRAVLLAIALLAFNAGAELALDALGVMESLLAPPGPRALLIIPLVLLFFTARLLLLFAAPGLLVAAILFVRNDR